MSWHINYFFSGFPHMWMDVTTYNIATRGVAFTWHSNSTPVCMWGIIQLDLRRKSPQPLTSLLIGRPCTPQQWTSAEYVLVLTIQNEIINLGAFDEKGGIVYSGPRWPMPPMPQSHKIESCCAEHANDFCMLGAGGRHSKVRNIQLDVRKPLIQTFTPLPILFQVPSEEMCPRLAAPCPKPCTAHIIARPGSLKLDPAPKTH